MSRFLGSLVRPLVGSRQHVPAPPRPGAVGPVLRAAIFLAAGLGGACGGGSADAKGAQDASEAEPPREIPTATGAIPRRDLVAVLDGGLPAFLQGVEVEPVTDGDDFVGFRVLALYPGDPSFADAPVVPGDIVTSVNGHPIERPEQAHAAWESLRVASEVAIRVLRDDEPREVRLVIVD